MPTGWGIPVPHNSFFSINLFIGVLGERMMPDSYSLYDKTVVPKELD